MARIRTIKPDFFTSGDIVGLSPLARLLFIGLWCEADRAGRFKWDPVTLKLRYLPADKCRTERLTQELVDHNLIDLYEIENRIYGWVRNFEHHQIINNRESESIIPAPKNGHRVDAWITRAHASQGKEGRKEGREGKGDSTRADPSDPTCADTIKASQVIEVLPLVSGSERKITEEEVAVWQSQYPAVDAEQEIHEMRAWLDANPTRRKTPRGINAFIVRWLSREQDKGRAK